MEAIYNKNFKDEMEKDKFEDNIRAIIRTRKINRRT